MGEINRRSLITGLTLLVAAPAIVRVSSLMSVKTMEPTITYGSLNATEAAAYYARLKTYFNSVGLWDKLDMIHTFGTPTEELAKINWKNYG